MKSFLETLAKLNQKSLDDIVFIELKDTISAKFDISLLGKETPLPVYLLDLADEIKQDNIDAIPAIAIIKGIVTVLGLDPNFKYNQNYVRLLKALDNNIEINLLADGIKYAENGDYLSAVIYFAAVLQFDPENIDAFYNIGRSLYDLSQTKEQAILIKLSRSAFEHANALDPDNGFVNYYIGFFKYNDGEYLMAKHNWVSALNSELPIEMKQDIITALGRVEDRTYFEAGSELILNGRLDEGLEQLKIVEDEHSDWWELNFFIGLGYRLKEEYDKAIGYFVKVLNLNSGHIQTMNELGICFLAIGDFEEAKKYYKEAMRLSPQNAEIICNMGIVYFNESKLNEALEHFELAYELAPEDEVIKMWYDHIHKFI